jgi:uncharacterized RDD family membrane protein YckC
VKRLDTARTYETPEGILLELKTAGPVPRACAWAIDAMIRSALYIAIALTLSWFGGLGFGVMLIIFFLIEWFYPVIFEVRDGMTPGKRMMGVQVVHDDGTPVGWPAAIVRNLVRAADFLPLLYGFGLVAMMINRDFKRLGDLAAGTLVIYREQAVQRDTPPPATPLQPPADLAVADQETLLDFAERSARLSRERNAELATILQGLTGAQGEAGVTRLHGFANWLAGRRSET